MEFCRRVSESLSVFTTQHLLGFDYTSLVDDSMYAAAAKVLPFVASFTSCDRGRFLGRYFLLFNDAINLLAFKHFHGK